MKNSTDKIITPENLRPVAKLIFNKSRLSGGELARMLRYDANALWLDVHQRGLSAKKAKAIAARCYKWAGECANAGDQLVALASRAQMTKKEYARSKRKVRRNRTT